MSPADAAPARGDAGAPRVVALVGATATGKTALGEALAEALGGEVVCADSRQLYGELEIGTGKPSPAERAARPHHLFDALRLGMRANAGAYGRAARETCAALHARGRVPVLVGGSGLYLEAARSGLVSVPPSATDVRERLRREVEEVGSLELHRRLALSDPETAARLAPRDAQRITRALEVLEASGRPLSWWLRQVASPPVAGEWRAIEITLAPRALAERIERRTRQMFEHGLVDETAALIAAGHGEALRVLRAVGYDEAVALLEGTLSRAGAEELTSQRTRQLAKRQRTWFRHQIEAVRLDASSSPRELLAAALAAAR
ncbi:MAG TPA: tRNA (adenosine(37)-N6)-dimethylallyltransferase MiaA [Candidatus Eisenbacteria bacterium]